jgi:hypothetical protein
MLQAHSLLWHYFWIAPNLLLFALGVLLCQRGLHRRFPAFTAFAILAGTGQLVLYAADVVPSVSGLNYWRTSLVCLIVEAVLKVAVLAEIFAHLCGSYPTVAKLGRSLIRGVAVILVFAAVAAGAYAQSENIKPLVSGVHLLEQTIFLIESGLLLFLFLFAAYFHLRWPGKSFGIALGLAFSASVHLATWATLANTGLSDHGRTLLDFANMATYHACVIVWFYFLLSRSDDRSTKPVLSLPDHDLGVLNSELERLLQR